MMKEHENMKRFRTFRPLARKRLWCLFACHMLLFSNFTFSQETMDTDKEKTKELDLSFQKINWDEFNGSAYRVSGDQIRQLNIRFDRPWSRSGFLFPSEKRRDTE